MFKSTKIIILLLIAAGLTIFLLMQKTDLKESQATKQATKIEPQAESILTSHLEMGEVELIVRDLTSQRRFYQELVGLSILDETELSLLLGHADRPVIRLTADPEKPAPAPGSAGLYHNAILFENRAALAQALERILAASPQLYSGSADHLVSEAFYFNDPEGNGVELYFDKDPATWTWQDGQVMMDSIYLDEQKYVADYAPVSTGQGKKMGHVHLKVGSISEAKNFYVDILGFRITAEMPTALFVSDGQYHHHLGMNVWQSSGAGPRQPSLGLSHLTMMVTEQADLDELEARLSGAGVEFEKKNGQLIVFDPWLNELVFSSAQ